MDIWYFGIEYSDKKANPASSINYFDEILPYSFKSSEKSGYRQK